MLKSVLRRVKVGSFCTHVRWAVGNLPSFLDEEKEEITKELDILETQTNAVRKNEYLEDLAKNQVPKLRNIISILALQLRYADSADSNAAALRKYIAAYYTGRHNMGHYITWAEGFLAMDAPADTYSATIFSELIEHIEKVLEIKDLYAVEVARIACIGRTIETRMRVIDLLVRAMEVAKGMSHRRRTREEALDAIATLETMCAEMRRNLPRRKKRKAEGEETEETAVSAPIAMSAMTSEGEVADINISVGDAEEKRNSGRMRRKKGRKWKSYK